MGIEKSGSVGMWEWNCKVCGKKTTGQKQIMQHHAETHIKGMAHVCHLCGKRKSTRQLLKVHISGIHSELFSCDVCGKTEMNRSSYKHHKRSHQKTYFINKVV